MTEEDLRRWEDNDEVAEGYLLEKFKNLWFYFPDKQGYSVQDLR